MAPRGIQFAKVFADLELNTKGFKAELAQSERSLGRIERFILDHPMAAAGALAGALVLVGVKATQMAAETEAGIRRIGAVLPDAATKAQQIKDRLDDIATSSGRTQAELLQTAETIAKGGVQNTEELLQRLAVIQKAADATGADMNTLAQGLDQVLDVFGLAGDQIEEVAAKLRTAAQGREPVEDLLGAFQAAAPILKASGVSFDQATAALARFVAEGLNSKQANTALKELVEKGGAQAVREFGGVALDAATSIQAMNVAAEAVANGSDRLGERIRANLNEAMRELGDKILPVVTAELKGLVGLLDIISGRTADIRTNQAIATINTLGPLGEKLGENAEASERLLRSLGNVAQAAFEGRVQLQGLAAADLENLQRNVAQATTALGDRVNGVFADKVALFQRQISAALAAALSNPPPAPGTGRTTSSTSTPILSDTQRNALKKGLIDTFTAQLPATIEATAEAIVHLADGLTKLGLSPAEVQKAIDPLLNQLEKLRAAAADQAVSEALSRGPEQALERLDELRQRLVDQLGQEQGETEQSRRILADIAAIDEARAKVNAQLLEDRKAEAEASEQVLDNSEGSADAAKRTSQFTAITANELARVARGAIGLAQAFGLANDNVAAMLQNVVSIGEALPDVVSELDKIGKVGENGQPLAIDTTALATGITAVLGGIAGLVSSFGDTPAAREAREITRQNTEAIREWTRKIDSQSRGSTLTQGSAAVTGLLARLPRTPGRFTGVDDVSDLIREVLGPLGLSLADLKDLAKDLGIRLNTNSLEDFIKSLEQLQERIQKTQLAAFTNDFAGQLAALQLQFDLLDLTNPLDQLKALQDLIKKSEFTSPALKKLLGGLDLSDPNQRAEAERRLQDLARRLSIPGGITAAELGGLSPQELADLIRQLEATIDQLNQQDGTTTGGPRQETFGVVRNITDTQADKLIGLAITQDTHLVEIRDLLADRLPFSLVEPPPVTGVPAGLGSLVIEKLEVNLGAGVTPTDADAVGRSLVNGIAEEVDRVLGLKLSTKRTRFGNALVN